MKPIKYLFILSLSVQVACLDGSLTEPILNQDLISVNSEDSDETDINTISSELLYMTSFLITRTIIENEEARSQFAEVMATSENNYFNLTEILNTDVTESTPFKDEFYEQFRSYNNELTFDTITTAADTVIFPSVSAAENKIDPGCRYCSPYATPQGLPFTTTYADYLTDLSNFNNLELYFPNQDDLDLPESLESHHDVIRTVCHPMNNNSGQDGMELYQDGGEYLFIDNEVVQDDVFVIVLRPSNTNGFYYGNIDFTAFLAN